ncbi:ammonium transporter AmtB-like domain-containing protein [Pseudomassariella vexata]|uniref:Ammonium transporter n=1 Tax=Pseudomassariella vexata TaxID=1141098 RepID=A0A1Y2DIW5_9PEZI|nr:ammonium transporter AmtB-like domain-containing protein [Pseudomassariella vexata]ORY59171.1 ammonium transporter AmtB-like domain-containing protein [Pseudomassariella vexata]
MPDGGNPLEIDVNAHFIVWLIIPGIGLLYGGMARRKSALSLLFQSMMVAAVITFQWMFWGYTLAYSRTAGPFIGDFANFGMKNVMAAPSPGNPAIPEIVFCLYQLLFCVCTVQIVVGGAFERGRIIPSLVFGFWWATVVYCPIACWTWNANGWLYNLPSLDFAGGGPVHIASGWSALAYALVLGKRKMNPEDKTSRKPHNTSLVFIGTVFIWFGWFGFNGGSALNASLRSMVVVFNTNTAASTGILGWVLVDYIKKNRRFSIVGACEGAIAGLVGITPAAGYVSVWLAAVIGFLTAVVCALCSNVNEWLHIDEGMDVFKLHGIGGMVGSFLTGIFATKYISALDGVTVASGAIDGEGIQVGKQFAEITAISAYSFLVSCALLMIMKYIPGLHLRISDEAEEQGLDFDHFFDEAIGDWSLTHALQPKPTHHHETIVGESVVTSSSSEHPEENKIMGVKEWTKRIFQLLSLLQQLHFCKNNETTTGFRQDCRTPKKNMIKVAHTPVAVTVARSTVQPPAVLLLQKGSIVGGYTHPGRDVIELPPNADTNGNLLT